ERAGERNGYIEQPRISLSSDTSFDVAAGDVGNPVTNRCSDVDLSLFSKGMECGSPLSAPCFNRSRCSLENAENADIYVFDADCSLSNSSALLEATDGRKIARTRMNRDHIAWELRLAANHAGGLAETYEMACLFIHVSVGGDRPCAVDRPLWNDGSNHVMVDMSDDGRGSRPEIANSYAIEAASNMHTCFYRVGYDISVSLAPLRVFNSLADIAPSDRKFFLTTKGTLYLTGHGSEERMSLVHLRNDRKGVVTSMKCFENHGEHLLAENMQFCEALKAQYEVDDYDDLMNTTFGLVPAGRSPGTFRLGEVMSAGSIPVFIGRDLVLPFVEQLDWPSFSLSFTPDQVGTAMVQTLRSISQPELESMQRKSLAASRYMFGTEANDLGPSAKLLLDILRRRLRYRGGRT
ncbi:unnamed protein product, partial [Scytosiphon promiscuus]